MLAKLSKMSMSFILVICLLCGQMVYASASEVSDPDEWNTIQNRRHSFPTRRSSDLTQLMTAQRLIPVMSVRRVNTWG